MLRHSVIMRKASTAFRTLRDSGVSGLLAKVRQKVYVWHTCFSARGLKRVSLDGRVFSLKLIPNNAMKVSLLKQRYERFERQAVLQYVSPEYPVVELGACIGVVACITNGILKNPVSHVVVEANPHVIPILQDNRDINRCEFEILNLALSYDQPFVTFSPSADFRGTSVRGTDDRSFQEPAVTVATTELGKIVVQRGYDRFSLICDIEGQEYELVMREPHILSRVDTLILETHARLIGEAKNREMLEKLADLGLRAIDQDSDVIVLRRPELA